MALVGDVEEAVYTNLTATQMMVCKTLNNLYYHTVTPSIAKMSFVVESINACVDRIDYLCEWMLTLHMEKMEVVQEVFYNHVPDKDCLKIICDMLFELHNKDVYTCRVVLPLDKTIILGNTSEYSEVNSLREKEFWYCIPTHTYVDMVANVDISKYFLNVFFRNKSVFNCGGMVPFYYPSRDMGVYELVRHDLLGLAKCILRDTRGSIASLHPNEFNYAMQTWMYNCELLRHWTWLNSFEEASGLNQRQVYEVLLNSFFEKMDQYDLVMRN